MSGVNLDGWWTMTWRVAGSDDVFHFMDLFQADDTGDTWVVGYQTFDRDGETLTHYTPSADHPSRTEYELTIQNEDLVAGIVCGWMNGVAMICHEVRMERTATPVGTLQLLGTVDGLPADVDSDTSYAVMSWHLSSHEYDIHDRLPYGGNDVELNFASPGLPGVGTYDVGASEVTVQVRVDDRWGYALAGTVTVTEAEADRFAGSFDVDLDEGGTVQGSCDVDILAEQGGPTAPVPVRFP
jgi:hypothetical protein